MATAAWVLEAVIAGTGRALRAGRPAQPDGPTAALRPGRVRGTRPHPGGPARPDLRGPVRLRPIRSSAAASRTSCTSDRPRRPAGPGHLRAGHRLAGRRPAERRGDAAPGARAGVARSRGAPLGCGRRGTVARHDRGARRPRRDRPRRRALRRPAARVPVRRARHAGGRRHEVQRLRAARLLRARRGRRAGGRHPRRPRIPGDPPEPSVPRAGDRPRRPDDRGPRLGGAAAQALPGRLRLDRAAAVRRRLDRGHGRHAGRPRGLPRHRPDALARARDGGHRPRLAGRPQPARPGGVRRGAQPRPGHRPDARAARRRGSRSTPTTSRCCPTTPSRPWWRRCPACRSRNASGSGGSSTSAGSSSANEPAYTSPFAWNLGRERARAALATLP